MLVKHLLRGDADLMIRLLVTQLVKCLLSGIDSGQIEVNGVEHIVIGNTTIYDIIILVRETFTACCHKVEPVTIICFKEFVCERRPVLIELINVQL